MPGPSKDVSRQGELAEVAGASLPRQTGVAELSITEFPDRDAFLEGTTPETAPAALHRLMQAHGFDFSSAKRIETGGQNLGYADLFIGKGPDGREVVAKIVGGTSRDFSVFGDNLQKDIDALVRAHRAGISELPALLATVTFADGTPAAVVMEKVDFEPEETLLSSLESLSNDQRTGLEGALKGTYRKLSEQCGLRLWDFQPGDVILKRTPNGDVTHRLRLLDGGSYELKPEGAPDELPDSIKDYLEGIFRRGSFNQKAG